MPTPSSSIFISQVQESMEYLVEQYIEFSISATIFQIALMLLLLAIVGVLLLLSVIRGWRDYGERPVYRQGSAEQEGRFIQG